MTTKMDLRSLMRCTTFDCHIGHIRSCELRRRSDGHLAYRRKRNGASVELRRGALRHHRLDQRAQ